MQYDGRRANGGSSGWDMLQKAVTSYSEGVLIRCSTRRIDEGVGGPEPCKVVDGTANKSVM